MKKREVHRWRIVFRLVVLIFSVLWFVQPVQAGKVSDFEKDATKKEEKSKSDKDDEDEKKEEREEEERRRRRRYHDRSHHHDRHRDPYSESFFYDAIILPGWNSWDRVQPRPIDARYAFAEPRETGEVLIPFFRLDAAYQNVDSDVEAIDIRAELGYGPIALSIRDTNYQESDPDDELEIFQMHALYRMSFSEAFEVDAGLGILTIDGDGQNSGLSLTLPVLIRYTENLGFEFRPSWSSVNGNTIQDYDVGAMLGMRFVALRAGYRWIESENTSLNGPYLGISIHF